MQEFIFILLYADDVVLFSYNLDDIKHLVHLNNNLPHFKYFKITQQNTPEEADFLGFWESSLNDQHECIFESDAVDDIVGVEFSKLEVFATITDEKFP